MLKREKLGVTICGSFRREPEGLKNIFGQLSEKYVINSPKDINFTDMSADFVRSESEKDLTIKKNQNAHLEAIKNSDFVWLYAPEGYVGLSGSMEIGYAVALGIPVLTNVELQNETLKTIVNRVSGLDEIPLAVSLLNNGGSGLSGLQEYYRRISARRNWDGETPKDILLLITEEIGELARAIRKSEGISRHHDYEDSKTASELADVQLYLVHLASALNIDLSEAVTAKENINAERFNASK